MCDRDASSRRTRCAWRGGTTSTAASTEVVLVPLGRHCCRVLLPSSHTSAPPYLVTVRSSELMASPSPASAEIGSLLPRVEQVGAVTTESILEQARHFDPADVRAQLIAVVSGALHSPWDAKRFRAVSKKHVAFQVVEALATACGP